MENCLYFIISNLYKTTTITIWLKFKKTCKWWYNACAYVHFQIFSELIHIFKMKKEIWLADKVCYSQFLKKVHFTILIVYHTFSQFCQNDTEKSNWNRTKTWHELVGGGQRFDLTVITANDEQFWQTVCLKWGLRAAFRTPAKKAFKGTWWEIKAELLARLIRRREAASQLVCLLAFAVSDCLFWSLWGCKALPLSHVGMCNATNLHCSIQQKEMYK